MPIYSEAYTYVTVTMSVHPFSEYLWEFFNRYQKHNTSLNSCKQVVFQPVLHASCSTVRRFSGLHCSIRFIATVRTKRILDERVCMLCKVVDDEIHFVTSCCINEPQRLSLYQKLITVDREFTLLSNEDKFVYLMANRNQTVITWFAKFIYHSFHARNEKLYMSRV